MKKQLFSALALAAVAVAVSTAKADPVASANTFGVLKVNVPQGNTLICVPWVDVGGDTSIHVTNIVVASQMASGDYVIWYYNNNGTGTYNGWTLNTDSEDSSTYYWQPAAIDDLDVTISAGANAKTLARGNAIIVHKAAEGGGDIYLSGQYVSGQATSTIAPSTTGGNGVSFTLISPSSVSNYNLNTATYSVTPDSDDCILLSDETVFYHDADGWYKKVLNTVDPTTKPTKDHDAAVIPAGQGAWYMRNGTGDLTITW